MKKILLSACLCSLSILNFAQTTTQRNCATGILPQQFETWVQGIQQNQNQNKNSNSQNSTMSIFNIPVVVHVIHNAEPLNSASANTGGNLNAAQIIDQINILNKDYNGLNPDTSLIPNVFKPLLGKFQVNFCLAVVNPTGGVMPEAGTDRINRVTKGWTAPPYTTNYIDVTIKPNSIWDPNRYFNIWVCGISGGVLGYATFPNPGTSGLAGLTGPYGSTTTDGVVILNTAFGSVGTGSIGAYNKGRTATHEVGHWIGLRHIWGDGTCLTDYCNDTPPAQTSNGGCPTFPYKLGVCTGNTTGEMTMNYMDYTNDVCMYMFSNDQKNRAQLIMTNSPMRASLITSTVCNLPSIGTDIGIISVASPTYSQVINCSNKINPIVSVTNFGTNLITNAVFNYSVNGMALQTYSWTGNLSPNTSATIALPQITNITNGVKVFSVTVSSPNGGVDNNATNNGNMQNFSIINSFTLSATSATACSGSSTTLTASGGASSYTWNPGAIVGTQAVYSPTATTIYTLSGSSGTCINTATTSITIGGALSITITPSTSTICSGSSVTLVASGAVTYTWNTGSNATSIAVSPTATTIYTVNATSGTCTGSKSGTVVVNATPTLVANSATICNGSTATLTASGATTYTWNPGNLVGASVSISPTSTAVYTVTGANGLCTSNLSRTVTVNALPTIAINPSSANICSGSSATFNGSGASTYTWSTGLTNASISLSPSVTTGYTLTGTSALGCIGTNTAAITVTTTPTVTVNNFTICSGGTITIPASGATTYSWNTGSTSSSITVSPSSTTVYTVTGFNGVCSNIQTSTITIGTALSVIISPTNPAVCAGNSATLTASGATTYTWSTGSNLTAIVVSPTTATTYSIIGASGACAGTKTITVIVNANPTTVLTTTNVSCFGGSNGQLSASSTGVGPFTYTYSPSGPTNVSAGNYTTITQASNGCKTTNTISVTQPSALVSTISSSNTTCGSSCNGLASAGVSGGTPVYSYSVLPTGGNASSASGLCAGTYTYIIKDANNCTTNSVFTINAGTGGLTVSATATNASCGVCNDGITSATNNGTGPFTYLWMPGMQTTQVVNNLAPGCYSVTVTDVNSCSGTNTVCVSFATNISNQANVVGIKLIPNPTNGLFIIECNSLNPKQIDIVDVTGRIITSKQTSLSTVNMDITEFASGFYFARITTDKTVSVLRIIKN